MKYKKSIILSILILTISMSFSSMVWSSNLVDDGNNDWEAAEFKPTNLTFRYNYENTTTYKGDTGLKTATCINEIDNETYCLREDTVRGMAYATNGTFEFDEVLDMKRLEVDRDDYKYMTMTLHYKNGTLLREIGIEDDDLTEDMKAYFDDYEGQLEAYYQKQQQDTLDSIEDDVSRSSSPTSSSGFYIGSGGGGYYHTNYRY